MQRLPFEKLHDQVVAAGLMSHVEDGADVRMAERCDRAGLALEACAGVAVVGAVRRKDLDRDDAVEPRVVGAIDLAHPARADRREDFIRPEPSARDQIHRRSVSVGRGAAGRTKRQLECADLDLIAVRQLEWRRHHVAPDVRCHSCSRHPQALRPRRQ